MIRILLLLFLSVCFLSARASSYHGGPEVGQRAPSLLITTWLQAPPEAAAGWPTGKVVVLEFWATWCGPCVATIPHLNELAERFKDKPVQFIAVSDQEPEVVRAFLQKHPIHAWVGLGAEAGIGTNRPYRVYGIPHAVLIDSHGRVATITDPRELTPELIDLCLADKPLPQANEPGGSREPGVVPGQYQIGRRPLFQALIRPVSRTNRVDCWSSDGLTLQPAQLKRAISAVFDTEPTRIVAEVELPKEWYEFYFALPTKKAGGKSRLQAVFAQSVEAVFGLTVTRETQETEAYVLKTNAASLGMLARSTNASGQELYGWDQVSGTRRSLDSLAAGLEHAVRKPVLNETGLTNEYSFYIKWDQKLDHPNPEGMTKAVNELGLELVPVRRSLELVVVRKASEQR
jgi:uncharacterized protein (TIGR03435 family)